jgi:hypothetical protein
VRPEKKHNSRERRKTETSKPKGTIGKRKKLEEGKSDEEWKSLVKRKSQRRGSGLLREFAWYVCIVVWYGYVYVFQYRGAAVAGSIQPCLPYALLQGI